MTRAEVVGALTLAFHKLSSDQFKRLERRLESPEFKVACGDRADDWVKGGYA